MFVPSLDPAGPPDPSSVLVTVGAAGVAIRSGMPPERAVFVGGLEGRQCWAVDLEDDANRDSGQPAADAADAVDLRQLWSEVDEATWTAAGRAVQLVEWARTATSSAAAAASRPRT